MDYELNNDDPKNIGFRTHKEYYFKCENNKHKSESNMIDYITTRNCLQCNNIIIAVFLFVFIFL